MSYDLYAKIAEEKLRALHGQGEWEGKYIRNVASVTVSPSKYEVTIRYIEEDKIKEVKLPIGRIIYRKPGFTNKISAGKYIVIEKSMGYEKFIVYVGAYRETYDGYDLELY